MSFPCSPHEGLVETVAQNVGDVGKNGNLSFVDVVSGG